MPKKVNLPGEVLDACQVLDDYGVDKKDIAKALKIHPATLDRHMKEHDADELRQENEQLRDEIARLKASEQKEDNIIELKRKKA